MISESNFSKLFKQGQVTYIRFSYIIISFIIAYIVSAILILLFVGIVLCIIVWLWALIDSIKSAEALNRGEFVEDKLF